MADPEGTEEKQTDDLTSQHGHLVARLAAGVRSGREVSVEELQRVMGVAESDCGSKLWFMAAEAGHIQCLHHLLTLGLPINTISVSYLTTPNVTALYCAAKHQHLPCFQFLLEKGAKIRMEDLIIAASHNDTKCLNFLVRHGQFSAAEFAFAMAAEIAGQRMDVEIFECLLQEVISHVENENGLQVFLYGALRTACSIGNLGYVRPLLQAGVSVKGNSEIMYIAASRGHCETMQLLHQYGASVNCPEYKKSEIPLIGAAGIATRNHSNCRNRKLWRNGDLVGAAALSFLLRHGARVDAADRKSQTAVIRAAYHGHIECVRVLVAGGCDVNCSTCSGNTAMHWAVRCASLELVQVLLQAGAHPDLLSSSGTSPFHLAVSWPTSDAQQCMDIIKLLIRSGADINRVHTFGEEEEFEAITAVVHACRQGQVDIIKALLIACCDRQLLQKKIHESKLLTCVPPDLLCKLLCAYPLQALCRMSILSCFTHQTRYKLHQLPLPTALNHWLTFPEYDASWH